MVCYAVPPYFLYHTLFSVLTLLYAGIKNIISILAHILSIKSTSRHTNSFSSSISLQIRILHNLHLSFSKMTFFTHTYFKLLFSNAPCITVTFPCYLYADDANSSSAKRRQYTFIIYSYKLCFP